MTDEDKKLDDLIRVASARKTDETATFRSVLGKIDTAERKAIFRVPNLGPNMAAAGFAAMMCMAGIAGYALPDLTLGEPEDDMLLLAFGETGSPSGSLISMLEQGE